MTYGRRHRSISERQVPLRICSCCRSPCLSLTAAIMESNAGLFYVCGHTSMLIPLCTVSSCSVAAQNSKPSCCNCHSGPTKGRVHIAGGGQGKQTKATCKQKCSITGLKNRTWTEVCSEPFKWQPFKIILMKISETKPFI